MCILNHGMEIKISNSINGFFFFFLENLITESGSTHIFSGRPGNAIKACVPTVYYLKIL